ncbi:D-alanine aminotransferase [Hydra vulgaris]|uniref:D-alanine aminotransferase n=1 Tax=Hydra vulgaris TaxID=6087 RepID=A0ABM4CL88_HYDVU
MNKISFLNGIFLPHSECFVHIDDRGFQMADGVYEVIALKNNKLIDLDWHIERLFRSLSEIEIKFSYSKKQLQEIIGELFKQNNLNEGSVYLQITRGCAPRQQTFPENYVPTVIATVSSLPIIKAESLEEGFTAITHQDIRWQRCDIKSTSLLASSWIKNKAISLGADDAILIRDEYVSEATFSNVFIVDKNDNLITRNADNFILCGITRNRIIDLAKKNNILVIEKKFSVHEMLQASEVFLTSTTLSVRPFSKIDGHIIGEGKTGKITLKLLSLYKQFSS